MHRIIKKFANIFGAEIMRRATAERLMENAKQLNDAQMEFYSFLDDIISKFDKGKSHAQLKQDIFVLVESNFKRNGYFVEFGATNGVDLSNTYLLVKNFGWDGILAEPAVAWHEKLFQNRDVSIETRCIWKETGAIVEFNMPPEMELSTISNFNNADMHSIKRRNGRMYSVETISLLDLLRNNKAPNNIDYLSIDTEGSEFEILNAFDFSEYTFNVITCEHNYTRMRSKIYELLSKNGYKRKFEHLSRWDDWYVRY